MVKAKWLASLSNGTTVVEGIFPFDVVGDKSSPWLQLQDHIKENDIHVTGLRIQVEKDGEATRTYNLPSFNCSKSGIHEKWATIKPLMPIGYNYFRRIRRSLTTSEEHKYIQIVAIFPEFKMSLIVDEDEGNESWVVVHE